VIDGVENLLIDVHTHVGNGDWPTAENLVKSMDSLSIDKAIVLPIESQEAAITSTDYVLSACSKFQERLIPFCCVDPRDTPDFPTKIRRYVDLGCKGFGEYKLKLYVDDPRSKKIYELCGKLDIPVLIHMDGTLNLDIDRYERLLRDFASTMFIAHGPSWWREISRKVEPTEYYPKGKVEPGGKVDHILQEYPNAYADLSAGSGYNALNRDIEFAKRFVAKNYKKLLFGTDYGAQFLSNLSFFQLHPHLILLKKLDLNETAYHAITHKNAERLLKL